MKKWGLFQAFYGVSLHSCKKMRNAIKKTEALAKEMGLQEAYDLYAPMQAEMER